jgi:hypothetical protein
MKYYEDEFDNDGTWKQFNTPKGSLRIEDDGYYCKIYEYQGNDLGGAYIYSGNSKVSFELSPQEIYEYLLENEFFE